MSGAECPQQLTPIFAGDGFQTNAIFAPQTSVRYPGWPLACASHCGSFQFWIPVVSSMAYTGTGAGDNIVFPVWAADGYNDDPWVYSSVPLVVGTGSRSFSTFLSYNVLNTTASTSATLVTVGTDQGNVFIDLGKTLAYLEGAVSAGVPSPGFCNLGCNVNVDWSLLTPGTTYHWRMRYATPRWSRHRRRSPPSTRPYCRDIGRGSYGSDGLPRGVHLSHRGVDCGV